MASQFDHENPCRVMETRSCPPAGPCGSGPCARFESDDPTPWLGQDDSELGRLAYTVFNRCYAATDRMPPFCDLSVHEQRAWAITASAVRIRLERTKGSVAGP